MGHINVGMFGLGVVGQGMVRVLRINNQHTFKFHVLCRDPKKERHLDLGYPTEDIVFATNAEEILGNSEINVIVELMGGSDGLALDVITRGLTLNIPVVTANKALIAKHMYKLEFLLSVYKGRLFFEGSVCGGMPLIHVLQTFHVSTCDPVQKIEGIVNGSTNYLLWKLEQDASLDFVSMIVDMTSKGYLEADPSQDLDGHDARAKLIILSRLAFGVYLDEEDKEGVACFGLPDLHQCDWHYVSNNYGGTIRLIASAKEVKPNEIRAVVMPTIVKRLSLFGMINKNYNCVKVVSNFMGEMTMTGEGAGGASTGQAVAHDVLKAIGSQGSQCAPMIFPPLNKNKAVKTWNVKDKFLIRVDKQNVDKVESSRQLSIHKINEVIQYCYIEFSATYADVRDLVSCFKSEQLPFALMRVFED